MSPRWGFILVGSRLLQRCRPAGALSLWVTDSTEMSPRWGFIPTSTEMSPRWGFILVGRPRFYRSHESTPSGRVALGGASTPQNFAPLGLISVVSYQLPKLTPRIQSLLVATWFFLRISHFFDELCIFFAKNAIFCNFKLTRSVI